MKHDLDKGSGLKNSGAEARMKPPKDTTVLQFRQWSRKKVNTVSQIAKSFLRMSWTTRLQICKLDRRSRSRCADSHTKHRGDKVAIAKLDKTSYKKLVQKCESIAKDSRGKIQVATL